MKTFCIAFFATSLIITTENTTVNRPTNKEGDLNKMTSADDLTGETENPTPKESELTENKESSAVDSPVTPTEEPVTDMPDSPNDQSADIEEKSPLTQSPVKERDESGAPSVEKEAPSTKNKDMSSSSGDGEQSILPGTAGSEKNEDPEKSGPNDPKESLKSEAGPQGDGVVGADVPDSEAGTPDPATHQGQASPISEKHIATGPVQPNLAEQVDHKAEVKNVVRPVGSENESVEPRPRNSPNTGTAKAGLSEKLSLEVSVKETEAPSSCDAAPTADRLDKNIGEGGGSSQTPENSGDSFFARHRTPIAVAVGAVVLFGTAVILWVALPAKTGKKVSL